MIEKLNELKEMVDQIICDDEWNHVETLQFNETDIYISNYLTGKKIKIQPNDTKKTLVEKIKKTFEKEVK